MSRTGEKTPDFTIRRDDDKGIIWINGKNNCLGRYCRDGFEVYREIFNPDDLSGRNSTLAMRKREWRKEAWPNFVALMQQHHNIDLSDEKEPAPKEPD